MAQTAALHGLPEILPPVPSMLFVASRGGKVGSNRSQVPRRTKGVANTSCNGSAFGCREPLVARVIAREGRVDWEGGDKGENTNVPRQR